MKEPQDIKNKNNDNIFFDILMTFAIGLKGMFKIILKGLLSIKIMTFNFWTFLLGWFAIGQLSVHFDFAHLRLLDYIMSKAYDTKIFYNFEKLGIWNNVFLFAILGYGFLLFIFGIKEIMKLKRYQNSIDIVGIKNTKKETPEVLKVVDLENDRKLLKVHSSGLSPSEWQKYKDNLSFEFRSLIDEIGVSKDKRHIEIILSKNDLPKFIEFDPETHFAAEPFSFVVGESKDGLITESIRECPHLLMGGATGMGKSTAFKLMLYSLLEGTPTDQIKFSLLDLKRGVEVADFEGFTNVTIAKNEADAIEELDKISKEMHRRYIFLEKEKRKKIDPQRDKLPLIIVAVDEASVIFGKTSAFSLKKSMSNKARELCQEIAKLGRGAGIHMILATQRATKTSIDTVTLDNLEARLCFRTRSVQGSTAILGNKGGVTIPHTAGRAIWQKGIKAINVQVPFVTEKNFAAMCESLKKTHETENSNILDSQNKSSDKLSKVMKSQLKLINKDEIQNL